MSVVSGPTGRVAVRITTSVVATVAALSLTATPALAGGPGHWTQLSSGQGVANIERPSLARLGTTLGVVWSQAQGSAAAIRYRSVSAAGTAGAASTVVTGWASTVHDPQLLGTGGGAAAVLFSGIRTTSPGEAYDGDAMYRATAAAPGGPWTLAAAATFPDEGDPYSSYGTGAVLDGSTQLVSYPLNTEIDVVGSDGSEVTLAVPQCCAYDTTLVRDAASGAVTVLWYANGSAASAKGVFAQQVRPSVGTRVQLPGSVTTNQYGVNTIDPSQAVAATTRAGGGVYAAYALGYPSPAKIRVQRVGGGHVDVTARDVRRVALTSTGSRLWLSWSDASGRVFATRSNTSATRFGAVRSIGGPGSYVYGLSTLGSAGGQLDVAVNAQKGAGQQIYHTQVLPGLTVKLSKKKVTRGGKVVVTVTDAGTGVPGAKVKVGKHRKATNANGKARFKVKASWATGTYKVVARHAGYAKDKAKLRVR